MYSMPRQGTRRRRTEQMEEERTLQREPKAIRYRRTDRQSVGEGIEFERIVGESANTNSLEYRRVSYERINAI